MSLQRCNRGPERLSFKGAVINVLAPPSRHQRLLAGDQDEAAEILEEQLKTPPVESIDDEVLVTALTYVKRARALGRLAENDQQFIFQATREILEDLDGSKSEASSSAPTRIARNSTCTAPRVRIVACPVRDKADELALLMFWHLLDPARSELTLTADETLTSE